MKYLTIIIIFFILFILFILFMNKKNEEDEENKEVVYALSQLPEFGEYTNWMAVNTNLNSINSSIGALRIWPGDGENGELNKVSIPSELYVESGGWEGEFTKLKLYKNNSGIQLSRYIDDLSADCYIHVNTNSGIPFIDASTTGSLFIPILHPDNRFSLMDKKSKLWLLVNPESKEILTTTDINMATHFLVRVCTGISGNCFDS